MKKVKLAALIAAILVMLALIVLLTRFIFRTILNASLATEVVSTEVWEEPDADMPPAPAETPFDASASAYEASEPEDEEEEDIQEEALVSVPVLKTAEQLAQEEE